MKRLLLLPALTSVAGLVALGWVTGYLWPVATTYGRLFMHDPPEAEADPVS